MTPIDPDVQVDGWEAKTYAKTQPEYRPLPCLYQRGPHGAVLSRWRPTAEELAALLAGSDLYLEQWTFGEALQPVKLGVWADKVL